MLAIIFTAFAVCVVSAIAFARSAVSYSAAESFGNLWTRAILSEYDRNLLHDYRIMAYFGNEAEVSQKLDQYLKYSMSGKLHARIGKTGTQLGGMSIGEPEIFRTALRKGLGSGAITAVINKGSRYKRSDIKEYEKEGENHVIGNQVVIDTLPSEGLKSSVDSGSVTELAKKLGSAEAVINALKNAGEEAAFIYMYMGNHITAPQTEKCWFRNEWEYLIEGGTDDDANFRACRRKLFLARNALDLISLYKDPVKTNLIASAAEIITPGPAGAFTQLIIAEAWAAIEADSDIDDLMENRRVPIIKTADQWKTDLDSVLGSDEVRDELDPEELEKLDSGREELSQLSDACTVNPAEVLKEGLNYDEHLMLMLLAMNKDVRLARIMDLVQINMKYRYYRDFNLEEYYTGVRFSLTVNGRSHVFEDEYH